MKRVVLLLLLISFGSKAQISNRKEIFNVGLKEGANTSQVSGDTYDGFDKFGFVGGGFVKGNLSKSWTPSFEILYTQKGSRHGSNYEGGDYTSYFLQLDYVEIPILIQYNIELGEISGLSVEMGPSIGFLVRTKEVIELGGVTLESGPWFNKHDVGLNLGVTYRFSSHFGFNFRYTNSILALRNEFIMPNLIVDSGQRNTVFAFCLTYDYTAKIKKKF